jgi:hypothetical protein
MVWVLRSSSPSVALRIDAKTLRSNVWGLHFVSQSMGNSISSCCGTFVLLWCVHQLQLAPNSLEQPSMLLMVDIQQKYSLLMVLLWLRYLEWGVHCCFWNQKLTIGWNYTVTKVCLLEHKCSNCTVHEHEQVTSSNMFEHIDKHHYCICIFPFKSCWGCGSQCSFGSFAMFDRNTTHRSSVSSSMCQTWNMLEMMIAMSCNV